MEAVRVNWISSEPIVTVIVPYWQDNYGYIVYDATTKEAALVDGVEVGKFKKAVEDLELKVRYVLTTHYHKDHAGGNLECQKVFPEVPIVGSAYQTTEGVTLECSDQDTLTLGTLTIECIHVPTHTKGHLAYLVQNSSKDGPNVVFTGDFLFIGGCGRFFEGNASTMAKSIEYFLTKVPPTTYMYPGHEYTISNLKFALTCETGNDNIEKKIEMLMNCKQFPITVPSTIEEELSYNPFIRCLKFPENMKKLYNGSDKIKLLEDLRTAKNQF